MSNRNPSGRKPKQQTIKVTLNDLAQMELVLPPIFNGLQLKVVVEFDGKATKLGFRSDGVKFDHDWSELKQFQGISGVVNRLTAEVKENRGKELAIAVLGPAQEEKVLDAMSQKLILFTNKAEQLSKLHGEIEKRVVNAPLEMASKKIALQLCKDIQSVIAKIKEKPKDFDFNKELTEVGIPFLVAERMSTPGFSSKDKDLISIFFPADPRNHLSLTCAEIENGGIKRFLDILVPQNNVFLCYLLKKFIPEQKSSLTEPKIAKFKWRFIPPLNIAQLWKNRDKVMYRIMGGDPAYQYEALNMAFYGAPTQIIAAPFPLVSQMREYLWGMKPADMAEAKAKAPEKPLDPAVFKQKFYSDYLKDITDMPSVGEEFKDDLLPECKPIPERDWRIDTSKVPKIEKRKKELSFQKGSFPVRGKECEYLLTDIKKTRYATNRSALANYLTNFKGEVQEHVARVLYARLITGFVDVEAEAIDEDAHDSDHEEEEEDD